MQFERYCTSPESPKTEWNDRMSKSMVIMNWAFCANCTRHLFLGKLENTERANTVVSSFHGCFHVLISGSEFCWSRIFLFKAPHKRATITLLIIIILLFYANKKCCMFAFNTFCVRTFDEYCAEKEFVSVVSCCMGNTFATVFTPL